MEQRKVSMITIKAKMKLYSSVRPGPFTTGYRPLFNFIRETKTSGKIQLDDREEFYPGDEGIVSITFISEKSLGTNFGIGSKFTFDEGGEPVGEGEIIGLSR